MISSYVKAFMLKDLCVPPMYCIPLKVLIYPVLILYTNKLVPECTLWFSVVILKGTHCPVKNESKENLHKVKSKKKSI